MEDKRICQEIYGDFGRMIFSSFASVLAYIQLHGYFIFFILMVIEGPIVNSAAAFAASLGYFNIFFIFFIAVLGDLTGDLIYFFLGRLLRDKINKGGLFSFQLKSIRAFNNLLEKHPKKSILLVKLTPALAGPGLSVIGASKIKFKDFIVTSSVFIIILCLFFTIVGYSFGYAFDTFYRVFKLGQWAVFITLVLFICFSYLSKKIYERLTRKIVLK